MSLINVTLEKSKVQPREKSLVNSIAYQKVFAANCIHV